MPHADIFRKTATDVKTRCIEVTTVVFTTRQTFLAMAASSKHIADADTITNFQPPLFSPKRHHPSDALMTHNQRQRIWGGMVTTPDMHIRKAHAAGLYFHQHFICLWHRAWHGFQRKRCAISGQQRRPHCRGLRGIVFGHYSSPI